MWLSVIRRVLIVKTSPNNCLFVCLYTMSDPKASIVVYQKLPYNLPLSTLLQKYDYGHIGSYWICLIFLNQIETFTLSSWDVP